MKLLYFLPFVFLVSCMSHTYTQPSRNLPHATLKVATVGNYGKLARVLTIGGSNVSPLQINGKEVGDTWKARVADRRIPAGTINLIVKASPSSKSPFTATANLQFVAFPNEAYILSNDSETNHFLFKVSEESSGKILIKKRSLKKPARLPTYTPMYNPMFAGQI